MCKYNVLVKTVDEQATLLCLMLKYLKVYHIKLDMGELKPQGANQNYCLYKTPHLWND